MNKEFALPKERLSDLPEDIQSEILDTLKAFNQCNVVFENGEYHASPSIGIYGHYAADHRFVGTFYAEDIYTLEERTENYIREFHDYPYWYKGVRNYAALKRDLEKGRI
jgi:hypothetical protein